MIEKEGWEFEPADRQMVVIPWLFRLLAYVLIACFVGLAWYAVASAAEPFKAALVKCTGAHCEVKYLYAEMTACQVDAARPLNGQKSGVRITCENLKGGNHAVR